ncbi:hypothetical protein FACS189454_03470 [Planctomycetales bacterium]|nr:hypothetical protein FACS189454_03470 [Planctomycetales bacterium]
MSLNDGNRRTGIGVDCELSGQVITVAIFEAIAEAVLFRRVIFVMEFAPIKNAEDVTGTRLLFDKLLQRFDEPLQHHLAAGKRQTAWATANANCSVAGTESPAAPAANVASIDQSL